MEGASTLLDRRHVATEPFNSAEIARKFTLKVFDMDNVVYLPPPPHPIPFSVDSYEPYKDTNQAIVIDNGSSTIRYGFCGSGNQKPNIHCHTNVVARFKDRKSNKPVLLFGKNVETDSGARAQARTPWEGDVLLNFDAMVSVQMMFGL
jgi:actin-related protein 5